VVFIVVIIGLQICDEQFFFSGNVHSGTEFSVSAKLPMKHKPALIADVLSAFFNHSLLICASVSQ
jgi:hypothetical protein